MKWHSSSGEQEGVGERGARNLQVREVMIVHLGYLALVKHWGAKLLCGFCFLLGSACSMLPSQEQIHHEPSCFSKIMLLCTANLCIEFYWIVLFCFPHLVKQPVVTE